MAVIGGFLERWLIAACRSRPFVLPVPAQRSSRAEAYVRSAFPGAAPSERTKRVVEVVKVKVRPASLASVDQLADRPGPRCGSWLLCGGLLLQCRGRQRSMQ